MKEYEEMKKENRLKGGKKEEKIWKSYKYLKREDCFK